MSARPLDRTHNYFEIFGLPKKFDIDQNYLSQQFRVIQTAVHPDNFANATDAERLASVQTSSLVNQAYQTLRNHLERAKYLLGLYGIDLSTETDTRMDPQFLMQQMELHETLENIGSRSDLTQKLLDLSENLDQQVQKTLSKIGHILNDSELNEKSSDLDQARDLVRQLQFLSKLQAEVSNKEELFLS